MVVKFEDKKVFKSMNTINPENLGLLHLFLSKITYSLISNKREKETRENSFAPYRPYLSK